jgi:hypothetical protein
MWDVAPLQTKKKINTEDTLFNTDIAPPFIPPPSHCAHESHGTKILSVI